MLWHNHIRSFAHRVMFFLILLDVQVWKELDNDTCSPLTWFRFGYLIHWIYWLDPGVGTSNTGHFLISTCNSITARLRWINLIFGFCYRPIGKPSKAPTKLCNSTPMIHWEFEIKFVLRYKSDVKSLYLFTGGVSKVSNKYLFCFLRPKGVGSKTASHPLSLSSHIIFSSQHLSLHSQTQIQTTFLVMAGHQTECWVTLK